MMSNKRIQCRAAHLVGDDRESYQRDLFDAIERRDYPKWRLCLRVTPEADADKTPMEVAVGLGERGEWGAVQMTGQRQQDLLRSLPALLLSRIGAPELAGFHRQIKPSGKPIVTTQWEGAGCRQ
jgi:hypothetical protein